MEVAELNMLRVSLRVTIMDKIRNEYIGGAAREARLGWFEHVRRKDRGYIARRMLRMELPGNRKRGRPKWKRMDAMGERERTWQLRK